MFLDFAAIQFPECVDNSSYDMAKGGCLTDSLEETAKQVSETTLPTCRYTWRDYLDTIILISVFIAVLL